MPDGTIITGVPEGITQTELLARYSRFAPTPVERQPAAPPPTMDAMGNVVGQGMAEPEYKERTILSDVGDVAKQIAAPIASAPFQIPRGVELGIKGLMRPSMEGSASAIMPSSVFQPGLDTEETLFGPENSGQTAQRKLQAQRAVAGMPSIPGAEALSGIGQQVRSSIQGSLSEEGKKALKESEIKGNIFKGELDFGKDPSVRGYALQIANVLGSMAPTIATAIITKSPTAAGAVGGGMAADEAGQAASEYISKIPHQQLLQDSPFYAELIAGGALPKEARRLTIQKAAESGAALQGLVATVGGTVTGKLVTGAFDDIIKKVAGSTRVGRAAGAGTLSGLEESLQETGEGVGSDLGIRSVIKNKEIGEDSAANAVLGFIGGAGPGGIRGLMVDGEAPKEKTAEDLAIEKGFLVPMDKRKPNQTRIMPTLEEQIKELMTTANSTPPEVEQVPGLPGIAPAGGMAATPAALVAEDDQDAQDLEAMLQELETGMSGTPKVEQVPPTTQETSDGIEATETEQAEAQGQKPAAAPAVTIPKGSAKRVTPVEDGTVDTWYDSGSRSWVTQRLDAKGNQIGDANYDGTQDDAKISHAKMVSDAKPAPAATRKVYRGQAAQDEFKGADDGNLGAGFYTTESEQAAKEFASRHKDGTVLQGELLASRVLDIDALDADAIGKLKSAIPRTAEGLLQHGWPQDLVDDKTTRELTTQSLQKIHDELKRGGFNPRSLSYALGDGSTDVLRSIYDAAGYDAVARTGDALKSGTKYKEYVTFSEGSQKLAKPAPAAKPPAAPAVTDKGPASRAPQVTDLKTYTPAEVKAEWERSSEGRRRSNLARLENKPIEERLLGKSWDEMSADERKLVRSAYDEDFFGPTYYINKQGNRVALGPKQAPVEKSQEQLDMERGKELWDGLSKTQKFDALLSAGIGKDAEQGQYSTWENLGPEVRSRILENKAKKPVAEEPKLTAEEIYKTLRKDEKDGNPIDEKMIKGMDLETAKEVMDLYGRHLKNTRSAAFRETPLRKAIEGHIETLPKPDRDAEYAKMMAEIKAKQGDEPTQMQKWSAEQKRVQAEIEKLKAEQDLESMFDDVLAEEVGTQKPAKTERGTEGGGTEGRTTTQAAKSAAKNTVQGFSNAIEGLGELFGQIPKDDGTINLNAGIPVKINEETYKKAKPLFQAAVANFQQAGADIREVMRAVIRAVLEKFGKDTTENMKPYIVRFVSEYQNEAGASPVELVENEDSTKNLDAPDGRHGWRGFGYVSAADGSSLAVSIRDIRDANKVIRQIRLLHTNTDIVPSLWEWQSTRVPDLNDLQIDTATYRYTISTRNEDAFEGINLSDGDEVWSIYGGQILDMLAKAKPADENKAIGAPVDENQTIINSIRDHLLNGGSFSTIVEARKFIEGITGNKIEPGTQQAKEADEMIEAGVVMSARQIIADGRKDGLQPTTIYEQLVDLYDRQPSLNVRSSTSVANQAYSTPAPLAFVASELAGINSKTSVYEPTGGNGMLLIGANPKLVTANELNEDRFNTLKRLYPEATVTQGNALDVETKGKSFDVVIENPPFGKVGDISNIDHEIAEHSLGMLDDDGRAVLILGGVQATTEEGRRDGYRGNAKRNFYFDLYNEYNVVDHFTVGGNMYSKQGTTYPVDVIVIDGVGKSKRDLPAADLPQLITSYEQLKEKLNDRLVPGQDSSASGTDSGVGTGGEGGREDVDLGPGGSGNEPGTAGTGPTGSGGTSVQGNEPADGGRRGPAGGRTGNAQPGAEDATKRGPAGGSVASTSETTKGNKRADEGRGPAALGGVSVVSGERVGSGLKDRAGQEQETEGQISYSPFSIANSVGTLVPRAMAESINNALATLEAAVGAIDEYVATSLEMDQEDVRTLFSAEQVDALALAIRNAEAGKGFIIGDQTGVGKGRVVAAMIRYALVNGKIPIFVTEKPNLYSDMMRDLDDINMTDELGLDTANPKILITNNDEKIPYTLLREVNGKIVENNLTLTAPKKDAELNALFKGMQESESLGDYKVIFTTYNQLQTVKGGQDTERRRLIKQFGAGNYMIFDESHNAGGAGETQARTKEQREKAKEGKSLVTGRAGFVRELVQNAFGTFFSSATYAKKPDVMDLYSSTDMKLAVNNLNELADAIKNGGIPMQQTVANMLAQAGQYIRRERTFAGVSYDTVETKVDKQTAENMATSMRRILEFSRGKEVVVKALKKEMDKRGEKLAGGSAEKTQVASANFGSIMHNLIDQMLLSLKVKSSIDHAIERLQAGEKVVMTVSNTMGSFLKDYADEMGLSVGDKVDLSFKDMYMRYLEKQRIIKIKPPGKNSVPREYRLTDADLGPGLVNQFNDIKTFIENAGFGSAPISPIDYLHTELAKVRVKDLQGNERNARTEEITGRTATVNYSSGQALLASRSSSIAKRVQAVKNFNNGTADVMILNQAGSTGLSLHANVKFDDTRKRHMIIIQPEKNIDTHMQMLGRVHRTGQVIPPAYSQMMADIPAEMRPAAVLLKKMASLNANTTGSRKSAVSAEGAVDFMNDYGGQVVQEYLRDNPEVYEALGGKKVLEISDDPSEASEEDIRKVTGYIPILPIKQQEEIYKDLVERYKELIEREDSMGSNKLESKAEDLDAKTIESKQITEDKQNESNSTSVFAKPAMMERVDVKRTVKPYSKNEVMEQSEENLKGKSAYDAGNDLLRDLNNRVNEYRSAKLAEMQSAPEQDPVKIENLKTQLLTQYNHAKAIVQNYPIGTPVSIKNSNGVFIYGVVTNIESKGKTKNPAAGSDMKMTLALANGDSKTLPLTFSQIGSQYTLNREDEVQYLNPETLKMERIPLIDMFDRGATVRREKRWMVTGNILAGYAAVGNLGRILTYTKDDGTTAQGVLMPRTFDFEKQQKNAPVKLKSVDQVMAFFEKFGPNSVVGTEGATLRISYRGGTQYKLATSSSKREGGTFFLDNELTKITGDFYKTGPTMGTTVYGTDSIEKTIQYLLRERGETLIALTNKDEARAAFQVPLANVEPDYNQQLLNPYMAAENDRAELISKFQSARQQRAAIVRKFMTGAAGLKEQAKLTELTQVADSLKAAIQQTKEPRRSAKNFFADATKQWDEGNISDGVYSVIKDVYEKFPFVLESLKLSVRKGGGNAAGQYMPVERFVYLYKGTSGVENPTTIRHELVHSLEQMMSEDATADLIEAWRKSLVKKMESDKSPKAQKFFDKLMAFYDKPTQESYQLALEALPSYEYYQYMNPSEFWAVNAEPLMARKLGSGWDRFVLAVKKLFEGAKNVFGFDNTYAVHKAFNEVMSGQQKRVGQAALVDYVTSQKVLLNNQNTRRNYKGGPAPLAEWTSAQESKIDNAIYRMQDKHIDTKRVVQAITEEIGDIADRWDPYLQEELYHGRTAKQTNDFLAEELQPLLKDMAKRGVALDDFEEYLHNRHAQAYNEMVASRNPEMPDSGSGLSTQEARDYLANLTPEQKANFEALASEIDKIVRGTQDLLVSGGIEKADTIAAWNDKLPFYVPLQRDPDELDFASTGSGLGAGFSTRGKFSKTATGSLKTVVDIFGNIALQRERAIIRSEKARVGRALYGLAITSPNPDFWMPVNPDAIKSKKKLVQELMNMGMKADDAENIIQEPKSSQIDPKTGLVKYQVNPAMRNAPNVFAVRINGEDRFIFFNPGDPRAKRMVEALKNLDANQLNEMLNGVAEATRAFAAMNTQYNPVFGAWNFIRDTMSASVNLSSTPIAHRKLAVLAGVNPFTGAPALRAIYRDLRGKGQKNQKMQEWEDLFERFQKAGGQTGYREQFSRSKERATIVQRELGKLDRGNIRKVVDAVFQWLSDYNDAMENAVRLSAFKVALEEGMSEERAASLAKNLTVNFNRKGQQTANVNALFAFFNASVQGSARMADALVDRTPKGKYKLSSTGKKIIAGGLMIGVAQAALLAMAGFDDDEPPEFLKNKNLIIPTGGGNYLIVPMPLGLNVFPNVGRLMTEFMFSDKKDAGKLGASLFGVVLDAFNPLGSSGLAQTISPTILDPLVGIATNRDAFGRPIAREDRATNPTPGYMRNRESASAFSKGMSYAINYMTGGGAYGIGAASPTADQIDYLIGQYTGGVGREISKAARYVTSKATGEETPPYAVPILGKAYGETSTPSAVTDKFYKNVTMLAEHEGTIKRMQADRASTTEYRRENPEVRLISAANNLENQVSKLNRTKKELLAKDQTDSVKAQIKRIDDQKARMMTNFNERVKAARQ
jgi:hypothetical protein